MVAGATPPALGAAPGVKNQRMSVRGAATVKAVRVAARPVVVAVAVVAAGDGSLRRRMRVIRARLSEMGGGRCAGGHGGDVAGAVAVAYTRFVKT